MARAVQMLYGREGACLSLPAGVDVLRGPSAPAVGDPAAALRRALNCPIGSPSLPDLLRAKRPGRAVITISDITRPVPNHLLLPPLLDALREGGVPEHAVTILIGTGMHRPSTAAERETLLGGDILARCAVIDHQAAVAESLVTVSEEPPVRVCRHFVEADFRIVTGLIEPHFMAGFSGGRKGVCPALVDLATVQRFHGYATLSHPAAENGVLAGNPCHAIALDIARRVGVDFLCNVAITHDRRLAAVYCGDLEAAHAAGCRDVAAWTGAAVAAPYDLVITCGGGYPLDQTLYQTVKGMCTALPALAPGATLLQISHCGEGIGSDAYRDLLLAYGRDWQRFLRDIAAQPERTLLDQWELQMQCRVLARIGCDRLRLVTDGIPAEVLARLPLHPVSGEGTAPERFQRAVDAWMTAHPQARVAVIPDGPYTLLQPVPA